MVFQLSDPPVQSEAIHIRPDQVTRDILSEYQAAENCTRSHALRQLIKRGFAVWQKERHQLSVLQQLTDELAL